MAWVRDGRGRGLTLGTFVLSLGGVALAHAAEGYQVVVHASNPVATLSRKSVSEMFLAKTTRWPDEVKVLPVDQSASSPVRAAFTRSVHGRSVEALLHYWQQVIFSGRGIPPVSKGSDREVLEFVAANPGAIGYVSAGSPLPATSVKLLTVSD